MSKKPQIPEGVALLSILLVGMNVLGLFWFSTSVARMANYLENVVTEDEAGTFPDAPLEDIAALADSDSEVRPHGGPRIPGIIDPDLCRPDQIDVADEALVIGIEFNGLSRAYLVDAFDGRRLSGEDPSVQVVNDVLGDVPLTVAHCHRTHSTRVLTQPRDAGQPVRPLSVNIGGFRNGLLLVIGNLSYPHHAKDMPLVDVPFMTTTWSRWKAEHPDSLVYTGRPCES